MKKVCCPYPNRITHLLFLSSKKQTKFMKRLVTACLLLWVCLFIRAEKHYTVIVSLDGFRWDYPQMYDTPFFDRMAQEGVKATMIPSFPTKTFPNH